MKILFPWFSFLINSFNHCVKIKSFIHIDPLLVYIVKTIRKWKCLYILETLGLLSENKQHRNTSVFPEFFQWLSYLESLLVERKYGSGDIQQSLKNSRTLKDIISFKNSTIVKTLLMLQVNIWIRYLLGNEIS